VSGLTPEEIKAVWRAMDTDELPTFDLDAFRKVNERRQAEGKPIVRLGEAADVQEKTGLSVIEALSSVLEEAVLAEIAQCKTEVEVSGCTPSIHVTISVAAQKRRNEIKELEKLTKRNKPVAYIEASEEDEAIIRELAESHGFIAVEISQEKAIQRMHTDTAPLLI
jgi:hypothetical protein